MGKRKESKVRTVSGAGGSAWENYGEYDDMAESNESLEELLAMVRTPNRCPTAGDDIDDDETEDASEEAGLGHTLATRTPGPKMRRGDPDPLRFGVGTGAGLKEKRVWDGLGNIEGERVGFTDWSGSSLMDLDADGVELVESERNF